MTRGTSSRTAFPGILLLALALVLPGALRAQDTVMVQLGLTYRPGSEPGFLVLPFAAASGSEGAASAVRGVVRQDLDFSDRFRVTDAPAGTRPVAPAAVGEWADRGADWVLAGDVRPQGSGLALRLALLDAVYGTVKGERTFQLPRAADRGFRMAVHAAADEVVRWATGEPGMAASRVAYVLQGRGSKEIYMVDWDGENVQRVTSDGSIALSPAWSPDGARIAYTSFRSGVPALYERSLATGQDREISRRDGLNITPAYSPDGRTLAFAATVAGNTEIAVVSGGGFEALTRGRRSDSLSPTFSPDGSRIAFVSNRLGEPHVYVMQRGGEPRLLSEYRYGTQGYNTSPDWSPRGSAIAYHTRVGGSPQLAVVDAAGGRPRVLTSRGVNEDPSWGPDGRHLVFASDRDGGGLFVMDVISGRTRPLLRGRGYGLPDWSPVLYRAPSTPSAGQ
ncbi:MAG: Tol-Pal system beta propeller repeat protein TolB [Longimicrobiaceae bacterium]